MGGGEGEEWGGGGEAKSTKFKFNSCVWVCGWGIDEMGVSLCFCKSSGLLRDGAP